MSVDVVRSHARHGELTLAEAAALSLLEDAPEAEQGALYAWLSRVRCRLGLPREALAAATEAVRKSASWEAQLALGEALVATGEPFSGRATLDAALVDVRSTRFSATDDPAGRLRDQGEAEVWLGVALAEACRAAGDPTAGLAIATRASTYAEEVFGATSPEQAEALHALAMCLHTAGQDMRARENLLKALAIRRAFAEDHPDVAATLDALGMVARARNRPAEAVGLHREALALWVRRLGAQSGPVGACRHALAQALHRTGDFAGAQDEMAQALEITVRRFGSEHVDVQIARFEHARFTVDVGQVEEGLQVMVDARRRTATLLGRDHPVVKSMDRWL